MQICVPSLRIEAACVATCYASEGGFSVVLCELAADSPDTIGQLNRVMASGKPVTVRCGMLETTGTLEPLEAHDNVQGYTMRIQSVRFGAPGNVA